MNRSTVSRELTKLHETIYRGSVQAVREQLKTDPGGRKGEFTLVVAGLRAPLGPGDDELQRIVEILLAELPARQAASLAAEITGAGRREAYRVANALKDARSGG
jgi:16S rRNA (cytidine1402-2'-O)-methyltransferase